jgi:hypothetical protein
MVSRASLARVWTTVHPSPKERNFMNMKRSFAAGVIGLSLVGVAASPAIAKERESRGRTGEPNEDVRRGRGSDDATANARKGHGADDAPGHVRHGGKDDGPNHG